jgi:hypothetical protein
MPYVLFVHHKLDSPCRFFDTPQQAFSVFKTSVPPGGEDEITYAAGDRSGRCARFFGGSLRFGFLDGILYWRCRIRNCVCDECQRGRARHQNSIDEGGPREWRRRVSADHTGQQRGNTGVAEWRRCNDRLSRRIGT